MSPGDCYDRALHEAKAGNLDAAKAFALVGLLGHLLGRERPDVRSLPLARMGDGHAKIADWAGLRPGEQDARD
jgi:hypothetical protein